MTGLSDDRGPDSGGRSNRSLLLVGLVTLVFLVAVAARHFGYIS